MDKETV